MKTINSISGGKTSAYLAANYDADYNIFSLVRTTDQRLKHPNEKLRKKVEDRIQMPFIGTLEDDDIIQTIFDLEQYIGQEITWVSGIPFDQLLDQKGGWLPNKLHRYCTTHMKISPIFYWWAENIGDPVIENIGFRAKEHTRAERMLKRCNDDGLLEFDAVVGIHEFGRHEGKNKHENIAWAKPEFPLINDGVFKWEIENFWIGKPVKFAFKNNCVGCFNQNPTFLNWRFKNDSESNKAKLGWFKRAEDREGRGQWRSDGRYEDFERFNFTDELQFEDFGDCDTGYCNL